MDDDEWPFEDWQEWGLSSATLKLARAYEHLDSVDAEVRDFFEGNPYVMASEANLETGERLVRAGADDPSIRLSYIVGDALHNLRSALDYLVWERTPPQKRTKHTGFPLLVAAPKGAFSNLPPVRGLAASDCAVVERLQPYKTRDPAQVLDEPLRVVHDLNVADKHKFVHLTGISLESSTLRPIAPPGAHIRHSETFPGPFEDGAILARVVVSPPETEVNMNFEPTFDVAFEPGTTPWRDMPVGATLALLAGAVEDALRAFSWV